MSYKREFIDFMVRAGVLTFGDFITKSGRKTPYFVNTGNYKTGEQISKLGEFYAESIMDNMKSGKISESLSTLFGPAYKGIPLAVSASIALSAKFGKNVNFCFNRKEAKGHGEKGVIIGYDFNENDSILIIEDVITAGTAIRETLPVLKAQAPAEVIGLIVSVDRMEKGTGEKTAIAEIKEEFGIETFPIVTVREIIENLHNREVDGKVVITDETRERMEDYLKMYCVTE